MSEPQSGGPEDWAASSNPPPPPPQGYPPQGYPAQGYPPPYPPPPVGAYYDPNAPYGRHPVTAEPFSDKSKLVAGLLQLFGLLGILGIGRMYMGQTAFGVAQLVGCIILGVVTCGFGFAVPVIWGIVDCVVLLTGSPRDRYGRPLRDGA